MPSKSNQHIANAHKANGRVTADFERAPEIPLEEQVATVKKIVTWINDREFFWLMEIRTEFNIGSYDTKTNKLPSLLGHLIRDLLKRNIINCTDCKKGQRQYMRTLVIDVETIGIGKNMNYERYLV